MSVLVIFAAPVYAQTCGDPVLADMRICSDQAAAMRAKKSAWLSCNGTCLVIPDMDGVSVVDGRRQLLARFDNARFLAGEGSTRNLILLPFLTADGDLLLADTSNPQSAIRLSLSEVVDGDAATLSRFVEEARLSADGRRFFVPSLDGPGFALWEISAGRLKPHKSIHPVLLISQSGRYAATVDPHGDRTFRVEDFEADRSFATNARFELDTPLFDIQEQYFVRRYEHNDQRFAEIYRLSDGKPFAGIPWPIGMSVTFRIEASEKGLELIDASPRN